MVARFLRVRVGRKFNHVGIPTHNQEKKNMQNTPLIQSNIETAIVSLAPDANARKQEVLALAAAVVAVTSPNELEIAVARMRDIKRLTSEVESTRKAVKQPVINLGKRIDEIAENFSIELSNEASRINRLVTGFQLAEQERVRKENERIEAERRQKEEEAAAALKEQERLANLSKPNIKKEIVAEQKVIETQAALQTVQTIAPVTTARASGLVVKTEVAFEITDAAALYDVRPEFFDLVPKKSVIKVSITKNTKLPGLKVWEETKTGVRG